MKDKISKIYNSFKMKSKKYFSTNILFSSYLILSILIGLTLRVITVGSPFLIRPILCDLMIALLIGAFGYLVKPHNQFKYFLIVLCAFTFLGIANSIYYTFYKSFISFSLIDSIKFVKEVQNSVFDKLKVVDLIFFLFPVLLIIVHLKLCKRKYYFEIDKSEKSKSMIKGTFAGAGIVLVLIALTLTKTDISRFAKQWNREYVLQRFGLYTYTINDLAQSLQPKINTLFGYDEAAREFREFYKQELSTKNNSKNEYTNVFEGKNIIVIHAESIQNFLIGLEINGKEVTPNLNKLAKNSLYFSKFYPQITIGTSSDTEFTFETGLLPSTSGITFNSYFDREYESIPLILKEKGYYAFSMHANNGDYWNRNVMYKTLGYDKYYSENSFVVTEDTTIGLGLSDREFYKQISVLLEDIKNTKEPFYGKIVTLSNHSPFNEIDKYGPFDLTMEYSYLDEGNEEQTGIANYLEGTEMGNYLKSSHYADQTLGELFELLEEKGVLDNTVVLLYGDHEAKISKNQFTLMYNYEPLTDSVKDETSEDYISLENYKYDILKNTPLMIWYPDAYEENNNIYTKEIKDVMGMYDLLPSLANMFNFEYKYAVGHDIFSDSEKIVIFPNGNFITNKVYYNSLKGNYISLTDAPISEGYIERLKDYAEKRLSVSNNLIVHDLIRNEEKNLMEEMNEK